MPPTPAFPGPTRRRFVAWAIALPALEAWSARPARAESGRAQVQVQRVGERYLVQAQALLEVPPVPAWDTLTDYERLPQFVPDLHRVQVVERNGSQLTVDYDGQYRYLFLRRAVRLRLAVVHEPPLRVLAAGGSRERPDGSAVLDLRSRYELQPSAAGALLRYEAQFELVPALPAVLGTLGVRHAMREQFEALVAEIARRHAAPR
ncbi:MAG: SRPBCC family protein [Betaproteobacteria bacterium]